MNRLEARPDRAMYVLQRIVKEHDRTQRQAQRLSDEFKGPGFGLAAPDLGGHKDGVEGL